MKKSLPTVTIGIPALNEYSNLRRLLPNLLSQDFYKTTLKEIIVMSDGSTDNTKNIHKELKDKRIKIISTKKRYGKAYQINKLFKLAKTNSVIVLDADVKLKNHQSLFSLSKTAFLYPNSLVSGVVVPQKPENFIQRIAYSGVNLWDKIRFSGMHSDMYLCEGSIRSFPRNLYKKLIFPSTSADEAFSYIETQRLGFSFKSCRNAIAIYTLPKNLQDFFNQQRRYINSKSIQDNNFSAQITDKFYTIKTKDKVLSLFKGLLENPLYLFIYTVLIIFIKITSLVKPAKTTSLWQVLSSTK